MNAPRMSKRSSHVGVVLNEHHLCSRGGLGFGDSVSLDPPGDAMTGVGKQLALLGVALIIGAALLQFGYDSPSISAGDEPTQNTPTPQPTVDPEAIPTAVPTATPIGGRDPATVQVRVANSTGVVGLAGSVTAQIETAFGYSMLQPVDSTGPPLDTTAIFAALGSEPQAALIAAELGLPGAGILLMPTDPPVEDLGAAEILVVVGFDLAPAE